MKLIILALLCSSFSLAQTIDEIAFAESREIHTDALVVVKDGKTLYEKYARQYDVSKKHLSWSMAKTISGIIVANAIEQGYLKLDDPLKKWVPSFSGTATVQQALQMSSGISFKEEYSGIPVDSDATKMLYLDGPSQGFANYTAALPLRTDTAAGEYFYYSSGDTNLVMEALKKALNDNKAYDNYPWRVFFDKLGIKDATFEQDSKGTFVGSSYIYMSTESYLKVAQLLMQKGRYNDQQIIPTWYFEMMNEVAPGVDKKALEGTSQTRAYSMQATTNRPIKGRNLSSEYSNLPIDALLMIGHQGQLVIASPSENLMIVRLATDKGNPFNPRRNELFTAIKKLIEDKGLKMSVADDGHLPVPAPVVAKNGASAPLLDYLKVPKLIKSLYAKELCSCLYVAGRNIDQCKQDMKLTLPILPFVSIGTDKVSASFLGFDQISAKYVSPELGCTLGSE